MEATTLRRRRLAAGLTQAELASRARVSQPNLSAYERGRRAPSPEVSARLEAELRERPSVLIARHAQEIRVVVEEHQAHNPRVFGSIARDEDTPGSDADIVVEFSDDASLLDEVGLRLAIQDLLGIEVDVVGADSLRGELKRRVLSEAVAL